MELFRSIRGSPFFDDSSSCLQLFLQSLEDRIEVGFAIAKSLQLSLRAFLKRQPVLLFACCEGCRVRGGFCEFREAFSFYVQRLNCKLVTACLEEIVADGRISGEVPVPKRERVSVFELSRAMGCL